MIWSLKRLLQHGVQCEIEPGVWVSARPVVEPFTYRLRAAWAVLTGRADALTWPTADDPRSWAAIDTSVRSATLDRASQDQTFIDRMDELVEIDADGRIYAHGNTIQPAPKRNILRDPQGEYGQADGGSDG